MVFGTSVMTPLSKKRSDLIVKRNHLIDIVKLVAAFGVIAIHVQFNTKEAEMIGDFFSPFCVPFFYIISLTYFVSSLKQLSPSGFFLKMYSRLALPFIMWTCVYVLLLWVHSIITHSPVKFVLWRSILYGQSAVQLYFLPQLIAMHTLAFSIYLIFTPTIKKVLLGMLLMALVICYAVIGYTYNCFGMTRPLAILAYLLAAFWLSSLNRFGKPSYIYLVIGILLVAFPILRLFFGTPFIFNSILLVLPVGGIGLALISFNLGINKIPKAVAIGASTTFGVYLSHVLFLEAFEFITPKIWKGGLFYNLPTKLFIVSLLFALSVLFTLLLKRFPKFRQLFLGESPN